jgi:membrane protein required for colicin V production
MQIYDIVMLIVLVSATAFGAWKGLAWQVASLSAIFFSYYVAVGFRGQLASRISATPPWNVFLAMLLLYVGTSFLIWLLFRFVSGFIDRVRLKSFDRQIGAMFGLAKGVVLCVLITLFAVALLGETQRRTIVESTSGRYIAMLLDEAHGIMPDEIHQVLHPYIHEPLNGQNLNPQAQFGGVWSESAAGEQNRLSLEQIDQLIPVDRLFQALGEDEAVRR